jgi:transposase
MTALTVQQIADRLNVSKDTVRRWIRRGDLKAADLSANSASEKPRWRVLETDLVKFISERYENEASGW